MNVKDLIRKSTIDASQSGQFDLCRQMALRYASAIWADRAKSYNEESSPTDEMPYGVVSGVSEVFKRVKRLKSLCSPLREDEYRQEDIERMMDTCLDMINYGSWMYALFAIAIEKTGASFMAPATTTKKAHPVPVKLEGDAKRLAMMAGDSLSD